MFASVQFKLDFENKHLPTRQAGDRERVLSFMRMQSSAIRFIYNRVVALVLPRSFTRDFSPLKFVIIEEKWRRLASRLVPSGFGGTMPRENTG